MADKDTGKSPKRDGAPNPNQVPAVNRDAVRRNSLDTWRRSSRRPSLRNEGRS